MENYEYEAKRDIVYLYEKEHELWEWWCAIHKEGKITTNDNIPIQGASKERLLTERNMGDGENKKRG